MAMRLASGPMTGSSSICGRCHLCCAFSSTPMLSSGHNRWSKIRHDKGAADRKKTAQRSLLSETLALYSKMYGPDPNMNGQLATVITAAKKAGMPKVNIDMAIARGQGKSPTGAKLESVLFETMMPPSVALVVDVETHSKMRAVNDLKQVVKKHSGTVTPTTYLFTRLGRTVLRGRQDDAGLVDKMLLDVLEAGAQDVDQDRDGNIVVTTAPTSTHQTAKTLSTLLKTDIISSEIVWAPASDMVPLDDPELARGLGDFLVALRANSDVQAIYANVARGSVSEELWGPIEENLDNPAQ